MVEQSTNNLMERIRGTVEDVELKSGRAMDDESGDEEDELSLVK